jgi:hypothetical protein
VRQLTMTWMLTSPERRYFSVLNRRKSQSLAWQEVPLAFMRPSSLASRLEITTPVPSTLVKIDEKRARTQPPGPILP